MMRAVDLFAGLGGFTQAAKSTGVKVVWAANHWQAAVDFHARNHPETLHVCQDLHQANWEQVPRMELLLASPACQGHAKARGKERPHHDACRSTAWAVVSCAEFHRPYVLIVENVPEFTKWKLFNAWQSALEALGYALSINILDAADAGLPQNRVRAFIIGTRSQNPLPIPAPTETHVPISHFIDWDAGRWACVRRAGRSPDTLVRFRHGRRTFGDRFVFCYNGNTRTARSINRPVGTITTVDRWAAVKGNRMRMFSTEECRRAMGFPADYLLPDDHRLAVHMLGNAVPPPLAAHVINEVRRAA